MKKTFQILSLMILVFSLSACGEMPVQKKANTSAFQNLPEIEISIKEMFETGISFECRSSQGANILVLRAKDKKLRIDGLPYIFSPQAGEEFKFGSYLVLDDTVYIWSDEEGKVISSTEYLKMRGQGYAEPNIERKVADVLIENFTAGENKYECRDAELDDEIFIPENNFKFATSSEEVAI